MRVKTSQESELYCNELLGKENAHTAGILMTKKYSAPRAGSLGQSDDQGKGPGPC